MSEELESVIPTLVDQGLYRTIEKLASEALAYGGNHTAVRAAVNGLMHEFRKLSQAKHSQDCVEAVRLHKLLKRTAPAKPESEGKRPRENLGVIENLERRNKLDQEQIQAAQSVRLVWDAFEKFMGMGAKNYSKGGHQHKASAPQPLDAMSQPLFEFYRERYSPWCKRAKETFVKVRARGGHDTLLGYGIYNVAQSQYMTTRNSMGTESLRVFHTKAQADSLAAPGAPSYEVREIAYATHMQIVQAIVIDGVDLELLDRKYGLERNTCLSILQEELNNLKWQAPVDYKQPRPEKVKAS
jgi:hypothetical protein